MTVGPKAYSYCSRCCEAVTGDLARFNKALAKYVDRALSEMSRPHHSSRVPLTSVAYKYAGYVQYVRLLNRLVH